MSNKINTCCKCGGQPELTNYISIKKGELLAGVVCPNCRKSFFGSMDINFVKALNELNDKVIARWNTLMETLKED